MNERLQQKEKQKKVPLFRAVLLLVVIPLVLAGVSYAWMYNGMDIETLLKLEPPSNIAILEPDQNKALDTIKLDSSSATRDDSGMVTFRQVFRVNSTGAFDLEIAHTTNLKGLSFQVYKAKTAEDTENNYTTEIKSKNNKSYYYSGNENVGVLTGKYVNLANKESTEYKFANKTLHGQVYYVDSDDQNSDQVQAHAEPLYWISTGEAGAGIDSDETWGGVASSVVSNSKDYYFVLEASWTDSDKETDIFYILAQNHQAADDASGGA